MAVPARRKCVTSAMCTPTSKLPLGSGLRQSGQAEAWERVTCNRCSGRRREGGLSDYTCLGGGTATSCMLKWRTMCTDVTLHYRIASKLSCATKISDSTNQEITCCRTARAARHQCPCSREGPRSRCTAHAGPHAQPLTGAQDPPERKCTHHMGTKQSTHVSGAC